MRAVVWFLVSVLALLQPLEVHCQYYNVSVARSDRYFFSGVAANNVAFFAGGYDFAGNTPAEYELDTFNLTSGLWWVGAVGSQ